MFHLKCPTFSHVLLLLYEQCTICDNDGVGIAREDGAVPKLSECTIERNGLATNTTKEEEVMMISPAKQPEPIASH